jgi:hypothetical protein
MTPRKLSGRQFFLDANKVNAKGKLPAMNQLEKWHADGVIQLRFPEYAQLEAEASENARRTQKAQNYIGALTGYLSEEDQKLLRKIEIIIFGSDPLSPPDKIDALNVFTAKRHLEIFVTADGKILEAADRLRAEIGIVGVITDESAVEQVTQRIRERDHMARSNAKHKGCPLPDWVGKDESRPSASRGRNF